MCVCVRGRRRKDLTELDPTRTQQTLVQVVSKVRKGVDGGGCSEVRSREGDGQVCVCLSWGADQIQMCARLLCDLCCAFLPCQVLWKEGTVEDGYWRPLPHRACASLPDCLLSYSARE